MGLLSDGGVHSHIRHLYGLLELAKRKGFEDVFVHCFMDGRDTPPASGEMYITELKEKMQEIIENFFGFYSKEIVLIEEIYKARLETFKDKKMLIKK